MSKRTRKDGFLDPKEQKRNLWKGIAALIGLILLFIAIMAGAMTGKI